MSKYTSSEFANAQFAEHSDGRLATRTATENAPYVWDTRHYAYTDRIMAAGGWRPIPSRPTITESELQRLIHKHLPDETSEEQVHMLMTDLGV